MSTPNKPAPLSMGAQLKSAAAALVTLPVRNRATTPQDLSQPKRSRMVVRCWLYEADHKKLEALTLHLMRAGFKKNEALAMQTAIQGMTIGPALLKEFPEPDSATIAKNFSMQKPDRERLAEACKYLYKHQRDASESAAARLALRLAEPDADFVALARDVQERYDHRRRKK